MEVGTDESQIRCTVNRRRTFPTQTDHLVRYSAGPHDPTGANSAQIRQQPPGPNWSYQAIRAAFDVSATTITTVRQAYGEGGLEAALNRKKPAREYPCRLDGEAEAHLIAMACSQPPEGHARWSLRLLRDRFVEMGYGEQVSHETIRQVLKKTN